MLRLHTVQCTESTKLKVQPELVRFLDCFYGFPDTEGLPLDFLYQNIRGEHHHYMYTRSVTKANFKTSGYAIPTGYTRIKAITRLALDDSSEDSIEMMI